MALWWEEQLRALRLNTIRERFAFAPIVEWSALDGNRAVFPWGGNFSVQVVQSSPRAMLVHTVLTCSKSEIDFLARALRQYSIQTSVPADAMIICLSAEAAEIDLASSMGIEPNKEGWFVQQWRKVDIGITRRDSPTPMSSSASDIGAVAKYPLAASYSNPNVSGGSANDWKKLLLSADFDEDLAASYAQLWAQVPCPSYKRAIPFPKLQEIPGTRMGHLHRLMKWANS